MSHRKSVEQTHPILIIGDHRGLSHGSMVFHIELINLKPPTTNQVYDVFFYDIRNYSIAGTFSDTNADTSFIQKISILKLRFHIPIYDIPIKKKMEITRAINTSKTSI